jgi:hypothetical protein
MRFRWIPYPLERRNAGQDVYTMTYVIR